jgi:hypothetical protein
MYTQGCKRDTLSGHRPLISLLVTGAVWLSRAGLNMLAMVARWRMTRTQALGPGL